MRHEVLIFYMHKLIFQFKVVCDIKSMTKAAEIINISQPTLTQNINRLERLLDVKLLIRKKNGIELTEFGESIYKNALIMTSAYDNAINSIDEIKAQKKQIFKIGCGYIWTHSDDFIFGDDICTEYPNLRFIIANGESVALQQKLVAGEYDLVLGAIPQKLVQDSDVCYKALTDVNFAIYARNGHPLANKSNVNNRFLADYQWVKLHHDDELMSRHDPYDFPIDQTKLKFEVRSVVTAFRILQNSDCLLSIPVNLGSLAKKFDLVKLDMLFFPLSFKSGMMYMSNNENAEKIANSIFNRLN